MSDSETQLLLSYVQSSSELVNRRNVGYHIVFKEGVSTFLLSLSLLVVFEIKTSHCCATHRCNTWYAPPGNLDLSFSEIDCHFLWSLKSKLFGKE